MNFIYNHPHPHTYLSFTFIHIHIHIFHWHSSTFICIDIYYINCLVCACMCASVRRGPESRGLVRRSLETRGAVRPSLCRGPETQIEVLSIYPRVSVCLSVCPGIAGQFVLWRGLYICRGGGWVLGIVTRPVVDQAGYQGWYSYLIFDIWYYQNNTWLLYISVVLKRVLKKYIYPPWIVWNPPVLWSLKLGAHFDSVNFQIPGTDDSEFFKSTDPTSM
jgi:hypothetical protein